MNDDGLRIVWSPVNQAWFLMWNESLLRIFNDKAEALDELEFLRRPIRDHRSIQERYPIDRKKALEGFTE